MAAVTICSDFGAPKNKISHCFHCFPIYLPWSDGTRCHDLVVWMLSIFFVFFVFCIFKTYLFNWRLITLQYCTGFCHTLTWISHGWTCVPHPEPSSLLPPIPSLRVIPVHWLWVPCFMYRTWIGDLFHIWKYTCFNAILSNHPTLDFSYRLQKSVLYICVSFAVSHIGSLLPYF